MQDEKRQLFCILLIVFMGFVGTSIAYPIFPPLFLHPTDTSIVSMDWSIEARNIFLGIALAAFPLGQFFGSPILGGLSDKYHRKRVLILSLSGSVLGYFLTALSLKYNWLWVLLLSRFFTGVMEGNLGIVRAMASDLEGISKYKSLGRINAMAAIGYVLGPLLGGFFSDGTLVSWFSFELPFYFAMLFLLLATLLAVLTLKEKNPLITPATDSIWQQLNLFSRFRTLFKNNKSLKSLLIASTIFTFSADIFYEFGPVYLTGIWAMTPSGIAIYNAILCITLAIGAGWLPNYLAYHASIERVICIAMILCAMILGLMVIFPSPVFIFILFGLIGLTMSTVTTNLTVQVSHCAHANIQGEALGTQIGLRTAGDACICLIGGFLISASYKLPIIVSSLIAFIAAIVYWRKFLQKKAVIEG
jgi:DHA1 family tetracycline resistance protein-like MFS transporter